MPSIQERLVLFRMRAPDRMPGCGTAVEAVVVLAGWWEGGMRAIVGQETSKQGFENRPAKLRGRRRAAYIGDRGQEDAKDAGASALLPLSRLTSFAINTVKRGGAFPLSLFSPRSESCVPRRVCGVRKRDSELLRHVSVYSWTKVTATFEAAQLLNLIASTPKT
jgi:hypothetical protein